MEPGTLAVVGALGGALIGSLSGWVGAYLSTKAENERHRQRLAFEMGFREWERHMDRAEKLGKTAVGAAVVYGHFYVLVLEALAKGRIGPDEMARIIEQRNELVRTLDEAPKVDLHSGR